MHTAPPHAMAGGSLFLGYKLVFEFLRHHDETNLRPKYVDHLIAMALLGAVGAATMFGGSPRHMVSGALFMSTCIGWPMWWLNSLGMRPGQMAHHAGIYYQDDATKDEIERIVHQDQ
jgi:hypothetical protein